MLKGLLFFIVIIIAVVSAIVLFAVNIILRFIRRMRRMATGELDEEEEYERQSTSRHQSQYTFRGGRANRARPTNGQQGYQTTTQDGKIIIDNRQPEERKRKIIDADEGEYVEFTEE